MTIGCKRTAIGCGAVAAASSVVFIIFIVPQIREMQREIAKKVGGPDAMQVAEQELRDVAPEVQLESHTCGLHTLRTVYSAFGMSPAEANLRLRLGIDRPGNPLDPESIGTLQPDMLRVLVQDKLSYERLYLSVPNAAEQLTSSLKGSKMAAALIRRRQNGNLHWVALRYESDASVRVLDSLEKDPYVEQAQPFVDDCLLSCIVVSPTPFPEEDAVDIDWAHLEGSWEMVSSVERYVAIEKRLKPKP